MPHSEEHKYIPKNLSKEFRTRHGCECKEEYEYIKKLSGMNLVVITTYKSTSDLLKKEYKINNFFYNKNSIINRFINFC